MIRKAVVIVAIALVFSILYCTTPLTKGNIVSQENRIIAAQTAQTAQQGRDIDTYPYTEHFEDGFPPEGWSTYNMDGNDPQWEMRYYYGHGTTGLHCVGHAQGVNSVPEDGWLVSPQMYIPTGGGFTLSFWSMNQNPSYYSNGSNSVLVSTDSPDPADNQYVGIWQPLTVSAGWYCNQVDLTPWQGQTIYVGFRYFGSWAHNWFLDDVTFEAHTGIHEYPWLETFESGVFPPYYWTSFDQDGGGTHWDWNLGINHTPDGGYCAVHRQDPNAEMQDGWLVSPHIQVPPEFTFSLSFWSCNASQDVYGRNSVHVSTGSNVPSDGEFTEIWSPITVSGNWTHNFIDLTPWGGQTITIAFRYQGAYQHSWYLDDVKLDFNLGISEFPYREDFESGVFPPYYWTSFDQDGSGTYWSWNDIINHSEGGTCSAMHTWDEGEPAEEGWLVSPKIILPYDGSVDLSFWSYNYWTQYYGSNALCISTGSPDPNDGDYFQIWSPESVTEEWVPTTVDLSLWAGMEIYVAWVYQGMTAHTWYLDDVVFATNLEDNQPPVISHLPLINTPRDDVPYPVIADVTDDLVFNNGISSVYLYYSINEGEQTAVEMQQARSSYYAQIPPQPLGTQISYFIKATDGSPEGNESYTSVYRFLVDNPVWLHYDDGIQTLWAGMSDLPWGVGVLFANPYYGENVPLQVQEIYGALFYDDTVQLCVYSADDEYLTNLTPLMEPYEAFYPSGFGTVTPIPELSITSPYFYVTFEDIDPGNFFPGEDIYYPNRCYIIWQGQNLEFATMNFFNVWMLEVLVESGADPYPAPEISFRMQDGQPVIQWTEVPGSSYYNVYATGNPSDPGSWTLYDSTAGLELGDIAANPCDFFRVTAVFDPANKSEVTTRQPIQKDFRSGNTVALPFISIQP
jgi:hypothetical protein